MPHYFHSAKRAELYRCIRIYKLRRKTILDEAKRKTVRISRVIKSWQEAVYRVDRLTCKLSPLYHAINKYFKIDIRKRVHGWKTDTRFKLILGIYYKFGLEQLGITLRNLRLYIGGVDNKEPTKYRRQLTKSFETIPENKELYTKFKQFYEGRNSKV